MATSCTERSSTWPPARSRPCSATTVPKAAWIPASSHSELARNRQRRAVVLPHPVHPATHRKGQEGGHTQVSERSGQTKRSDGHDDGVGPGPLQGRSISIKPDHGASGARRSHHHIAVPAQPGKHRQRLSTAHVDGDSSFVGVVGSEHQAGRSDRASLQEWRHPAHLIAPGRLGKQHVRPQVSQQLGAVGANGAAHIQHPDSRQRPGHSLFHPVSRFPSASSGVS